MTNSSKHILIIDDDTGIRELLKDYLNNNGYQVDAAANTQDAKNLLNSANKAYNLIICDVMMPGENGFEFTEKYKNSGGNLPILLLTAMGESEDRIKGLECGADDYLAKPFAPKELQLRIDKLIERFAFNKASQNAISAPINQGNTSPEVSTPQNANIFKFGDFEFNLQNRILTKHNERIILSPKESNLLYYFTQNVGKPTNRYDLAKEFNGISERSIDVQITRLRQKIEKDSKNPVFIQTDWGKGYVFRI